VTVYRSDGAPYELQDNEELTGNDMLSDFRCRAAELFYLPQG
jgi:hypothetical protein